MRHPQPSGIRAEPATALHALHLIEISTGVVVLAYLAFHVFTWMLGG